VYAAHRVADIINGQLLLFFVLPGTDFPGPEDTSSRVELMSPIGIAIEVLVAAMLVAALAPSCEEGVGGGRRSWSRALRWSSPSFAVGLHTERLGRQHGAAAGDRRRAGRLRGDRAAACQAAEGTSLTT
jgi:hypothetical protein